MPGLRFAAGAKSAVGVKKFPHVMKDVSKKRMRRMLKWNKERLNVQAAAMSGVWNPVPKEAGMAMKFPVRNAVALASPR